MGKIAIFSGLDVIKILIKNGFIACSHKGSHVKLQKGDKTVIVPLHNELAKGTLLSIIKQSGMSKEEFFDK